MSLAPSSYYHRAKPRSAEAVAEEARLVLRIREICAEFPRYGYRRVTAQLKAEGERVNHERVSRIMREQDLRVRPKRRLVVTTNSDHDGPIFPDLAKDLAPTGPDQLWVADLTYIRILGGFVVLAVILDAWSRRGGRLGARPLHRCRVGTRRARGGPRQPQAAAGLCAPQRPVEDGVFDRNTLPSHTASSSRSMGSRARWAGAATPTTTPRRRAS